MMGAIGLSTLGILTALLCLIVTIRHARGYIVIYYLVFPMFALGSLGVGAFYIAKVIDIYFGVNNTAQFVVYSRWLWVFFLLSVSMFCITVLITDRKHNDK